MTAWCVLLANKQIEEDLFKKLLTKRKCGTYHWYSPEQRAKIAHYANEDGLKVVSNLFAGELGYKLKHLISQGMQKQFKQELSKVVDPAKIQALPHCS